MSVASATSFIKHIKNHPQAIDDFSLNLREDREEKLKEGGFEFTREEFEDGAVECLRDCIVVEEADEVQMIRQWFLVLHFMGD